MYSKYLNFDSCFHYNHQGIDIDKRPVFVHTDLNFDKD